MLEIGIIIFIGNNNNVLSSICRFKYNFIYVKGIREYSDFSFSKKVSVVK